MGQRRDTGVARHTGGWIVLGAGLLGTCLMGTWSGDAVSPPSEDSLSKPNLPSEELPASAGKLTGFPKLRIDINEAGEAELSCIEGIGPALAKRLVEHRRRIGRFRTLADLDDVPGVGPQLVRRLQDAIQPLADTQTLPESDTEIAVTDPRPTRQTNPKIAT